jgi:hypothetical protein
MKSQLYDISSRNCRRVNNDSDMENYVHTLLCSLPSYAIMFENFLSLNCICEIFCNGCFVHSGHNVEL